MDSNKLYNKNFRPIRFGLAIIAALTFLSACSDEGNTKQFENALFGSRSGDNAPPTIVSTNPADASANVPVTTAVRVAFSEDIDPDTVNASTFTLTNGSAAVTGSVTYDPSTKTATFRPSGVLSYSGSYSMTLTKEIRDTSGNAMTSAVTCTFTTEAPPTNVPGAPNGVTATAGDKQVTVSWNATPGATSYNIYWSLSLNIATTSGTKITNVESPYVHTGRTNGKTYYYIVTAVNSLGEGDASTVVSAAASVIAAPTGVTATAGNGQVTLSWNAVSDATSYNIYWASTSGVTKTSGSKISNVTSPNIHAGRTNGATYYYVITAVNSSGESIDSNQVSATPSTWAGVQDTTPPTGAIAINNGAASTKSLSVTLALTCTDDGSGCAQMQFSNDNVIWSPAEPFAVSKQWTLNSPNGTKTVWTKFKDNIGNWSTMEIKDDILLATIFSDNMESGSDSWFVSSNWVLSTEDAHSGSYAWTDSPGGYYSGNMNASLTSIAFNTTGLSLLRLSFWHKYALDVGDFGKIEVSTDNGVSWAEVASYGPSQSQSSWAETAIDLSAFIGYPSVKIRFRLQTDNSWISLSRPSTADGWHIDDVEIQ